MASGSSMVRFWAYLATGVPDEFVSSMRLPPSMSRGWVTHHRDSRGFSRQRLLPERKHRTNSRALVESLDAR
jgi:hypothetical protein